MLNLKKDIKFKNIFFDFDGVIANSVSCKTEAFRDLYLPYGDKIADQVVQHHFIMEGCQGLKSLKYIIKNFLI